ncbi:NAD(P)H-hydrate dehydratase [Bacillus carboniphilus]|uniref:Bifunctional NAD(P)H-hydrate repair enzyme n=1 Tax=Bacillus carboniphilus TaxID=86663 RepID=A0ABY9JXV1_9BACI|nr:NAD(P)H-hydrate dehydratase [Bacillus carboniphilus]WLR43352.1 NAD(P)H-hydrate dehydratase [Bacillus carboniphilus]
MKNIHVYRKEEIKEVDQVAEKKGHDPYTLMEVAGKSIFDQLVPLLNCEQNILVLCGRGNNGGDGLVIARLLQNSGYKVSVTFPLGETNSETVEKHLSYYHELSYQTCSFEYQKTDVIIDSLLGIGTRNPLSKEVIDLIEWVNNQSALVISIDLPSGIEANSGYVEHAIKADRTFSLHGAKYAQFLLPSGLYFGDSEVIDIGLPQTSKVKIWNRNDFMRTFEEREQVDAHKGTFGTGYLIAGSDDMPGSAVLASMGALKGGIGKLIIGTTIKVAQTISQHLLEATYQMDPYEKSLPKKISAIAIGSGLPYNQQLDTFINKTIQHSTVPIILDAGALQHRSYKSPNILIITPHPGEMARIVNCSIDYVQNNRIVVAQTVAKQENIIVVLKGHYTVVAFPDGDVFINSTGNAALAKGGSGDVLVGLMMALLSNQSRIKEAVVNAVYIHGLAADLWVGKYSAHTLLASDLTELFSVAMSKD